MVKRYAVKVKKFNQDHDPGTGRFGGPGTSHMPTGGKPGPAGAPGGPSMKQRMGVAGSTVVGGLGGQVAGDIGGAAAGGVIGGAIGGLAGPEGILPGAALGEKIGQISGEIMGSLAGDALGMKIGNKLMDVKAKADQHAVGMGAMMGGEAAQMAAWAATKFIPGLRAAAPLFEFLPSASKPAGLIAARSAQAAVDVAGSAAGGALAPGGRQVPNAVKRGLQGAKAGLGAAGVGAKVGSSLNKSRYVKARLAKHFFDKPPAGYADKGTFGSMYSSSLPNLFGPRAWSEISGTKFGSYVRQRVKLVAAKMDDAAAANDIDLTPAKPADVHAAAASLLQQSNQQQQGMQEDQQQHELDMAAASQPLHQHTHQAGSIEATNVHQDAPAPAPGAGGGNPTQPGGQKAGGPKAPFGKADTRSEQRDRRGRWSLGDKVKAVVASIGTGGGLVEAAHVGVKGFARSRSKEEAHQAARARAREAGKRRADLALEALSRHSDDAVFHEKEVKDNETRLRVLGPMFDTPEVMRRRQRVEEHLENSKASLRAAYHGAGKAFNAYTRAYETAQTREAEAGTNFPPSKLYAAGRAAKRAIRAATHPRNVQDLAWNAVKYGSRLFRKDLTLMRAPNDASARLYQQSGTPSDVRYLRQMQATIEANRKIELNRSLSQPKVESLQRAPGEDERMYRDRMHRVMQASINATDKLRPQLFDGGASEAGLSGAPPDQQRKRYTVKTKLGKGESRFKLDIEFAKEWNTPDTMKQGLVYGWASVIEDNGQMVTDHEGDRVEEVELVKAAHHYISNSRQGGVLHDQFGHNIGHIVESVVFTKELQKALGIDLKKVGWLIGYQVVDPRVKLLVRGGLLKSFSIGGKGRRVPVND